MAVNRKVVLANLAEFREALGVSQGQLGELMGVVRQSVSKLEAHEPINDDFLETAFARLKRNVAARFPTFDLVTDPVDPSLRSLSYGQAPKAAPSRSPHSVTYTDDHANDPFAARVLDLANLIDFDADEEGDLHLRYTRQLLALKKALERKFG